MSNHNEKLMSALKCCDEPMFKVNVLPDLTNSNTHFIRRWICKECGFIYDKIGYVLDDEELLIELENHDLTDTPIYKELNKRQ